MTAILPPSTFSSRAAWRGNELWQRNDWLYRFTVDDIEEIERALEGVKQLKTENLRTEDFSIPNLAPRLRQIQHSLEHESGAAYLKGFPVDRFSENDLKRIFWGVASHIGTPVSQSAKGEKIFSVRDEGFKMGHPKARGPNTSKGLHFHTDRCDVISFFCVNQAKHGGENYLVSSVVVHNQILEKRPDLLEVLYQPYYYQRHNVDTANEKPYCHQPIFAVHQGHFIANVLRVLIERAYKMPQLSDMTPIQREALDFLDATAEDPTLHTTFRQEPGDLVFVNNFVVFHSRSEFEDHEAPEMRRHLLRIWLSVPNSRPLAPAFACNYGSVGAGALRGGIHPPR